MRNWGFKTFLFILFLFSISACAQKEEGQPQGAIAPSPTETTTPQQGAPTPSTPTSPTITVSPTPPTTTPSPSGGTTGRIFVPSGPLVSITSSSGGTTATPSPTVGTTPTVSPTPSRNPLIPGDIRYGGTLPGSTPSTGIVLPITPPSSGTPTVTPSSPLVADFSFNPITGTVPTYITFQANASGGQGNLAYEWGLSNGQQGATGQTITTLFTQGGIGEAQLLVRDATGQQVATTKYITLSEPLPHSFSAKIMGPPLLGTSGGIGSKLYTFSPLLSGGTSPYNYGWSCLPKDPTIKCPELRIEVDPTSGLKTATGEFSQAGTYTITLAAADAAQPQHKADDQASFTIAP